MKGEKDAKYEGQLRQTKKLGMEVFLRRKQQHPALSA